MPIFAEPYKPPPPDPIPIFGEPPFGLAVVEELVRTIEQSGRKCDHTLKQVKEILQTKSIDVEPAFKWLYNFHIYCDCALVKAFNNRAFPQEGQTQGPIK